MATWNGRISPVFDVARQLHVFDIKGNKILAKHEDTLPGAGIENQAGRLSALGAQVLICGAISCQLKTVLSGMNIRVIPFTAGDVDQVLGAWLVGSLPNHAMTMPGCCELSECCGGGRGRKGWRRNAGRGHARAGKNNK